MESWRKNEKGSANEDIDTYRRKKDSAGVAAPETEGARESIHQKKLRQTKKGKVANQPAEKEKTK